MLNKEDLEHLTNAIQKESDFPTPNLDFYTFLYEILEDIYSEGYGQGFEDGINHEEDLTNDSIEPISGDELIDEIHKEWGKDEK